VVQAKLFEALSSEASTGSMTIHRTKLAEQ